MQLTADDEQRALTEGVRRLLNRWGAQGAEHRDGSSLWGMLADMGLTGLRVPEDSGGADASWLHCALVLEELGGEAVYEPYVPVVVATSILSRMVGAPAKRLLSAIADGTRIVVPVINAAVLDDTLEPRQSVRVERVDQAWRVSGVVHSVEGGSDADAFVVVAPTEDGVTTVLVVEATGVLRDARELLDGSRVADLVFDSCDAERLEPAGPPKEVLEDAAAVGLVLRSAESVGAMDRMLRLTRSYLEIREQFGQRLATYQELRARVADMYVSVEQSRSLVRAAAALLEHEDAQVRHRAAKGAKILADMSARHVGQEATQLHGGIGMTAEYPLGRLFKRVTLNGVRLSDTYSLRRQLVVDGGFSIPC